ncbi:MAG TPA: alcohol dehydrogenase catalytic domain-containing protein [Methylomirabilota bacterium]|nr:alcohol dehydrogenase catalytic domain-containing protein [Methylomirabilota bacterium]
MAASRPATMRAQVLRAWGDALALETVPVPAPRAGEALLRVDACGVGLTVLNYMNGNQARRDDWLPRIPGHELVGTVVETGAGVTAPRVGERVMAYFYLACGGCDLCRLAHEPLCRNLRGNVGVAADGGYAEYCALPAFNLLPVPAGVSPVAATAIPDAIATPFHVSRRAGIAPPDTTLVMGAGGGVGVHMVQMARLFGARVVGIDVGGAKLAAAREAGADAVVDAGAGDLVAAVRAAAAGDVTVAIDFVGSRETLGVCLDALGRRGRLVVLTTFPGVSADVAPRRLVHDEVSVLGSRYASRWELARAGELVATGRIRPVVSAVVPLERVGELHARLRARTLIGRGAVAF